MKIVSSQEHEREREIKTHSYWYIPLAPRVNYSLLIMESIGMIMMATREGFPPPAGCRNGSRLVFGGYRGLQRWNSRSRFLSGSLGIYKRCWSREQVRGPRGGHEVAGGAPAPLGAPPYLVDSPGTPLTCSRLQHLLYKPQLPERNLDREFLHRKPL